MPLQMAWPPRSNSNTEVARRVAVLSCNVRCVGGHYLLRFGCPRCCGEDLEAVSAQHAPSSSTTGTAHRTHGSTRCNRRQTVASLRPSGALAALESACSYMAKAPAVGRHRRQAGRVRPAGVAGRSRGFPVAQDRDRIGWWSGERVRCRQRGLVVRRCDHPGVPPLPATRIRRARRRG